ncbi:HlyD family secretion protein [Sphingomonas canadensis]|uniref:HlyD family secretion protein n=1 Tax=Sphingomonas canadensis TaxID=1219257 RepID=A0ABW3H3I3_9SPHN|nr:HlyD family efflux transporter periplasmic adaptor subunit [Sphingomonas canadensis]MCW3835527.1 HlyD family efflux transporter periplasmic adaptor subunit [Sphingomonas canadensis]
MKPQRAVVFVLAALALGFLAWRLLSPQFQPAQSLSGYIEGESLYLASPVSGSVARVSVRRGDRVAAGAPLFAVEPEQQAAQDDQAAAEYRAALAQADDVRKGQRPAELGVYRAELNAAEAQERETRATLARVQPLVTRGFYPRARLDDAKAAHDAAAAQVTAARQRLEAATLGAREDQVRAADARVAQAQAALRQTSARTATMSPNAPAAGRIEDVFYQTGEYAAANQPIVALIPDNRVFVRFFVPEAQVAKYRPGARVRFACDGCPAGLTAVIAYVSPRPEFTPPVIYSRESRDRLVFLVEARPEGDVTRLNPGLPVDVVPL